MTSFDDDFVVVAWMQPPTTKGRTFCFCEEDDDDHDDVNDDYGDCVNDGLDRLTRTTRTRTTTICSDAICTLG